MFLKTLIHIVPWMFFIPGMAAFVYVVLSVLCNKEKKKKCLSRPSNISKLKAFTWVYIDEILLKYTRTKRNIWEQTFPLIIDTN